MWNIIQGCPRVNKVECEPMTRFGMIIYTRTSSMPDGAAHGVWTHDIEALCRALTAQQRAHFPRLDAEEKERVAICTWPKLATTQLWAASGMACSPQPGFMPLAFITAVAAGVAR